MSLFDLSGKVAIITGGSRGIGLAIAEAFAQHGAKVAVSSRKQDGVESVAEAIRQQGGDAVAFAAHNGDKSALAHLVESVVAHYGRVDILVNNAATNPHFGPVLDADDGLWQKIIEVNIMGTMWLTQAVVPVMRSQGGGKIINISSVNGLRPGRMQGIYSMSKAAMNSLTQTLAMELASDKIYVNAIAPGLIKTKFAQALWDNEVVLESVMSRTPLNRIGEPDDIAGMAVYLASSASNFATGQVFVVDGGMTVPSL